MNQKILIEHWLFVKKESRGRGISKLLFDALKTWGKSNGASLFIMILIEGLNSEALSRYYRRLGFQQMESHYIMRI